MPNPKESSKDYTLIVRYSGSYRRGKGIGAGSLDSLREMAKDLVESGEFPNATLLYIVSNRGSIYEGYEVVDGELVKGYRKYPTRKTRGGYRDLNWGSTSPPLIPEDITDSEERFKALERSLQEPKWFDS